MICLLLQSNLKLSAQSTLPTTKEAEAQTEMFMKGIAEKHIKTSFDGLKPNWPISENSVDQIA